MHKFEYGEVVRIIKSGRVGFVKLTARGSVKPVGVVDACSDDVVWYDDDELALVGGVVETNDAGENTNCTIDETLEERGNRYGTFKGHSELSQRLLQCIRFHCVMNDKNLSDVHTEALTMICHKMARIVNGDPDYDDSWRDIAGYATLVVKHLNGEDI